MCFRFIPNNTEAGELRGAPLFKHWRPFKNPTHKTFVNEAKSEEQQIEIASCETWFVLMPSNEMLADYICGDFIWRSVVDYHADVLRLLGERMPLDMALAGLSVTDEAWEWWSQPNRQAAISRSLRCATVVTTPWPDLVEPLREINPNVILLPDYKVTTKGRRFTTAWGQVGSLLTERRGPAWKPDA